MSESPAPTLGSVQKINLSRKHVYILILGLAFLLPILTWLEAAGAALLALLFSLFVVPCLGIDLGMRARGQLNSGARAGIATYALSVLLLILLYRNQVEVVAAVWAVMALGDSSAEVAGMILKGPRLPWNGSKTWAGFAAFGLAGTLGAFALMRWVAPTESTHQVWLLSASTALVGAAVESLPVGLDDNLTVPLVAGAFLFCASMIEASSFWSNFPFLRSRLLFAVAVNLAFALAALALRAATVSGAAMGCFLGVAVYLGYGFRSFSVLLLFFVLGSAATRLGYARKAARGVAERRGGRRGWREAAANLLAGACFSILAVTTPYQSAFLVALVASFAEAAGDTISSEIGQWLSNRAYLITNLKPVLVGENGGISVLGTAAGIAASALVSVCAYTLGLCGLGGAAVAFGAAVAGNLFDSLLGATLERRGLVTNGIVNFACTSFAGAVALILAWHWPLG